MFKSQTRIKKQLTHLVGVHKRSNASIRPHFVLTGPSGSGKSFLTKQVCEEAKIPFFEVNAAQLTAEGLSGNSISKALRPLLKVFSKPNVCFVDEFDKLFQRGGQMTQEFRSQVQDEFLHMLESKDASVFTDYGKYEPIKIDNTLFIFAGAFQGQEIKSLKDLREIGLRPEFVGRVPLVFTTNPVTVEELLEALPHTDLLNQYIKLEGTKHTKATAVKEISKMVVAQLEHTELGIRLLNSVTHQFFMKDIE